MASWQKATWSSDIASGLPRADRASGTYHRYVPDVLLGATLKLDAVLDRQIAEAERAVHRISDNSQDLAAVSRFLLRSEAIASSQIEGIAPTVKQIAFAELASEEETPKVSELAKLVANNMTAVEKARSDLVRVDSITPEQLIELQEQLLTDNPELGGIRTVQNWIGGSAYTPIGADFVPPAPEMVPALMDDLVAYMNGAAHSPIVQAALVHAQFETIHPFADGNGRVGRALIQTILTRRGLTPSAVLPISMVLSTLRHAYLEGLNAYRHSGPLDSPTYHQARMAWITVFTDAVLQAAEQAEIVKGQLQDLREGWNTQLERWRKEEGFTRALRADSASAQILKDLPSTPILSVKTVERIHQISTPAANKALGELAASGILSRSKRGHTVFYHCDQLLDLVTLAERQLASTRFDTRVSKPNRPVPAKPQNRPLELL